MHETLVNLLSTVNTLLEKNQPIIPGGGTDDSSVKTNQKKWRKEKKRKQKIRRGKETVKNLSNRKLTDSDYIHFGKGLKFCPKPKSHDKIKLAAETFNYTRRLRLKE